MRAMQLQDLRAKANSNDFRTGVLCIILCFALGIANIFHFDIIILWSVLCLYVVLANPIPIPIPSHPKPNHLLTPSSS
jgi:hypothetical protein